jgi:hypothetical protein
MLGRQAGAGSLVNRLPSPCAGCSGSRAAAARPCRPVRMWLKRGLLCRKLHCPPRQKSLAARRIPLSDDVMIAAGPHKACNTAAAPAR